MARTVKTYRQVIEDLLEQYAGIPYGHDDLVDKTVFDRVHDRYLLITMGWQGRKRVNTIVLHIDIYDDKVWVQCNNTDQDVINELASRGIPRDAIVWYGTPEFNETANESIFSVV